MVGKISVQYGFVLAMVAILFVAPLASAQTEVVNSKLTASADALASEGNKLDRNATSFIIYNLKFCTDPGGFSPTSGGITVTPTVTSPDYATVGTLDPVEIAYPTAPGPAEVCVEPEAQQASLTLLNAPYGETLSIKIDFTVEPTGDQGTIKAPSPPDSLTFSAPIEDEPAPEPGQPGSGGGGGGGNGEDPEAAESPAPLPMALVLTLVGFAAIRRRHD